MPGKKKIVIQFDPAEELRKFQVELNKFLDKVNDNVSSFWNNNVVGKKPSADITHDRNGVDIVFHLHGVNKKDVVVDIAEKQVIIHGQNDKNASADRLYRLVPLPAGLDITKARQKWDGFALTIQIPKRR